MEKIKKYINAFTVAIVITTVINLLFFALITIVEGTSQAYNWSKLSKEGFLFFGSLLETCGTLLLSAMLYQMLTDKKEENESSTDNL